MVILKDCTVKTVQEDQQRVLVRWTGLPASMATWEDLMLLRQRFPASLAWGQASFQEGENVSTTTPPQLSEWPKPQAGPPVGDQRQEEERIES